MTALINGLLWFAMFAIPMLIAVILRRLGRKYGWPTAPPETRSGARLPKVGMSRWSTQRHGDDDQDEDREPGPEYGAVEGRLGYS
jgi:hypothetical protein